MLKHMKNRHTEEIRNAEKIYVSRKYSINLGKWRQLKEDTGDGEKGLVKAVINSKEESSTTTLANKFSKTNLEKIKEIKNSLPASTTTAETTFKKHDPWNEEEFK